MKGTHVMDLAEALVVSVVARVLDRRAHELRVLERDTSRLESVRSPFPRLTYDDAVRSLQQQGLPIEWGGDWVSFKDGPHFQLPAKVYS